MKKKGVIVGLTGGIACGKTTVAKMLEKKGAKVIDVDVIGHKLLQKGKPTYEKVVEAFGSQILNQDGEIVRSKLGNIVFSDPEKLEKLNQIVHPTMVKIAKEEAYKLAAESDSVAVIDAALLVEVGLYKAVDLVLLITSDRGSQVKRIVERSKLRGEPISLEQAESRIESQLSFSEKMKLADYVIDNSDSIAELSRKVGQFWCEKIKC